MTEVPAVAVGPTDGDRAPLSGRGEDTTGHATMMSASGGAVGLLSYGCTLVMAHLLAPPDYTVFAAAAALVGVAGVASTALIPLPLAHVVRAGPPGSSARVEAMTFAAAVSVLVGSVTGAVLGALASGFASTGIAVTAGLSALALFAIAPVWGFLQGEARFRRYAVLAVGEVAVRLAVSVGAVALGAGAAGAVGAFAVGAAVVLGVAGAGALRDVSSTVVRRVVADRVRWAETGSVAAVQTVLSTLAVADVVAIALVMTPASGAAAAGYQAVATLAKAPVYVAVGTALVSFPVLRVAAGADRDRRLREALAAFVRLVVPAVAVVATVPAVLVGLVLPASYLPATTLLPWLAAAGAGLGGVTVLATLLLAVRAQRALVLGLIGAVLALGLGMAVGLGAAADATVGFAYGTAAGAWVGVVVVGAAGWRHRPRLMGSIVAVRGVAYAVGVVALLGVARFSVAAWVLAVVVLGLALVGLPVIGGRVRVAAEPGAGEVGAEPDRAGLRVLHLGFEDPAMPGSGGGAHRTLEIDRRLAAMGWRIVVVTTRYPGCVDSTERHGPGWVRWVHLGVGRGGNRLTRWLGYVLGVPLAVRAIDSDLVVEDFCAPASSMGVPWFSVAPVVGMVQWLNARDKATQYKIPVHVVQRVTVRAHRRLVAVSEGVAEQLRMLAPRARIAVIGNGVDRAAFHTGEVSRGDDVVFVGRLEIAQKGLDLLVDAWARVAPHVRGRLVLVGSGPDEAALHERVRRHDIADRVHFVGWKAGAEKFELLASARVAVVPSRFETFGIVAAEALATGTAVVAFDIACLREVLPAEAGSLVPLTGDDETDVAAYAASLRELYDDDARRARVAERGPVLAGVHDWDVLARDQEAFYRAAVGAGDEPAAGAVEGAR